MRKFRIIAVTLSVAALSVILAGCTTFDNFKDAFFTEKGAVADTINIGVLEPQTGADSEGGDAEIRGIEIAHSLKNEVLGKKIQLIYADTQSSIYVAESAAADLTDKKPAVVLGSYGEAASLAASEVLGELKIPAITITATNPLVIVNNPYYFGVSFTDANQGSALASYIHDKLGLNQAAIVKMKNDDNVAPIVDRFESRMKDLTGGENSVNELDQINPEEPDYEECIYKIKQSGLKAVFMPVSLETAGEVFKAASESGVTDVTFVGTKDWHGDELLRLQKKYPNVKIAVASDFSVLKTAETEEKSELYNQFIKAYKEKYGSGEPEEATALAFDAYMIAVQSIEKADSVSKIKVRDAIASTKDFKGASGNISFGSTGEPTKTINVNVIQNGKYVSVYTVK